MPLIDHSQFKEDDEGMDDIIEIVVAVVVCPKGRVHESFVTTVELRSIFNIIASELY